jgi:hypothetical protein
MPAGAAKLKMRKAQDDVLESLRSLAKDERGHLINLKQGVPADEAAARALPSAFKVHTMETNLLLQFEKQIDEATSR